MLSIIVAMSQKDRIIGLNGDLPWKLSADLRRFKEITTGKTVIMGRKTWESIPAKFRPLPNRRNIVLSRTPDYQAEGAEVCDGLNSALELPDRGETFLIGGEAVFAAGLALAERLYVTFVDYHGPGDTFFPDNPWNWFKIDPNFKEKIIPRDDKNSHLSQFLVLRRL